ncbi:hypothetical protein [Nocardia farcinica]|uniref:hypothetical protein n=1 Tax=Nocardia farcinica TaxID=37329 RepID=UPI002458273D|nr:hypothetical protein [Nocardia farcinica]
MTFWTDVADWNHTAGVPLRPTPGWVNQADLDLAYRLVEEERDELATALRERDMIETADAIADGLWVRAGLLLRLGLARDYIDLITPSPHPPTWEELPDAAMETVIDELHATDNRLRRAIHARNLIDTDVLGHRGMYQLSALAVLLRIPLDRVWAEVARSNFAKFVDGKVIRRDDGKILKPADWTPPDIRGALQVEAVQWGR